jgi:hypothetical protein
LFHRVSSTCFSKIIPEGDRSRIDPRTDTVRENYRPCFIVWKYQIARNTRDGTIRMICTIWMILMILSVIEDRHEP